MNSKRSNENDNVNTDYSEIPRDKAATQFKSYNP